MTNQTDERLRLPSASKWHRYELCSGSFQLEQEARRLGQQAHSASTDASRRGELIHAYLAGIPDEDGKEITLSESEQTTADFLQERAQGEIVRIFGDEPTQQLDEKRLWLTLNGARVASGRFDRCVYTKNKALLIDFKTGWQEPQPIEQNAQMKMLAVLVGIALPSVEQVIVQIVSGPFGVTEARYDLEALSKAYSDVLRTLRAIGAERAPFNPSPEACQWCPALNICQAVKDLVKPVAKLQYSALPDGSRAAKLLDEVELLQNHLDEIRAYYKRRLLEEADYQIPNYALVPGVPKRQVKDWIAARGKLEEFVDARELDKLASYSIPACEKLLGAAIKMKGEKLKNQFATVLGDLLELRHPEPSLKRVEDKTQAALEGAPP